MTALTGWMAGSTVRTRARTRVVLHSTHFTHVVLPHSWHNDFCCDRYRIGNFARGCLWRQNDDTRYYVTDSMRSYTLMCIHLFVYAAVLVYIQY